jgi:hypothetical protein
LTLLKTSIDARSCARGPHTSNAGADVSPLRDSISEAETFECDDSWCAVRHVLRS